MPAARLSTDQTHARRAVRALVDAALHTNVTLITKRGRLAKLALDTYDVAIEYDTNFHITLADLDKLKELAENYEARQRQLMIDRVRFEVL